MIVLNLHAKFPTTVTFQFLNLEKVNTNEGEVVFVHVCECVREREHLYVHTCVCVMCQIKDKMCV